MGVSNDILSSLPESLLSAIVSFLPFKEAVRTSILSKDWVNVYKSTRKIEFNELFFVNVDQSPEIVDAQRRAFSDFVRKWIEKHREDVIDKFSLTILIPEFFCELIDQCFRFALRNGVKDLELDFTYQPYDIVSAVVVLPTYFYGCSGFESLKLYACEFVASQCVNFHSLKKISLGYMGIKLHAIKALLTNCEKLESLSFLKCWNSEGDFILNEEYLGLKKLVINRCDFKFNIFRVNALNLKVFNYHGLMIRFAVDIQSPALDEVNLDFSLEYRCQGHGSYLYKFLKEFSSAKVMTVCSYLLQVIYTGGRPKKMYPSMNVKHLIMKATLHHFEFMGVSFMLRSCPYLERLTIEIVNEKYPVGYEAKFNVIPERYWVDSIEVYKCVKKHLKEIEIKSFKGTKNELNAITYFLTHGKVLRKLSINFLTDERNVAPRRKAEEHFRMLPKASTNLEISIY